ncbi:PREDICTED: uncharacterized protein LOC104798680 [Tarenaya hassleriana]|uniref:uncharacterized protein LOC104798680 n=1 Tax=Tarenaya hassleriana TaxID=28532 RepID=UPI00053C18E6|nr:PREDICTED: uncharacterized protein LOC104798680 [Tarenaya hassleriana]
MTAPNLSSSSPSSPPSSSTKNPLDLQISEPPILSSNQAQVSSSSLDGRPVTAQVSQLTLSLDSSHFPAIASVPVPPVTSDLVTAPFSASAGVSAPPTTSHPLSPVKSSALPVVGVSEASGQQPQAPQPAWSQQVSSSLKYLKRVGEPKLHPSGLPIVTIPEESLIASKKEWELFVIGKFYGVPPSMGHIIGFINSLCVRGGLKVRVHSMGNGSFLFKLPNLSVKNYVLDRELWHIGDHPLLVMEWDPDHDLDKPALKSVRTWVELRNVPQKLFSLDGEPLFLDRATEAKENFSVARIFVDIRLHPRPPHQILLDMPKGDVKKVDVTYTSLPPVCGNCQEVGHKMMEDSTSEVAVPITDQAVSALDVIAAEVPTVAQLEETLTTDSEPFSHPSPSIDVARNSDSQPTHSESEFQPVKTRGRGRGKGRGRGRKTAGGLNSQNKCQAIKSWLLAHRPLVGAFLESHILTQNEARFVAVLPPGWKHFSNHSADPSGRIWIVWSPEAVVTIYHVTDQAITYSIEVEHIGLKTTATFVYARNLSSARIPLWNDIRNISVYPPMLNTPWIVLGDFNQILRAEARSDFPAYQPRSQVANPVSIKLDRAVINEHWLARFPGAYAEFLAPGVSDHSPCLVNLSSLQLKVKRPFKYFDHLSTHPSFGQIVAENWAFEEVMGTVQFKFCRSLKLLKNPLRRLNKRAFNQLSQKVKDESDKLETIQSALLNSPTPGLAAQEHAIRKNWLRLLQADERVKEFFRTSKLLRELNATIITLVPKIPEAAQLGDFRPISCCNFLYKLISKILANRLKLVLPWVISGNQVAFQRGRNMMDHIMLASELIQDYHKACAEPSAMFKMDIKKAFDTISWDFILDILKGLALPPVFIGWIRACISSPSFSVAINGELAGFFPGKRGLRQGDPISPYLFILSMEALSRSLDKAMQLGSLAHHPRCGSPLISHLVFADDLMVFVKGELASIVEVKRLLSEFGCYSGLTLNPEKSELFLGGMTQMDTMAISSNVGFRLGSLPVRYLGVPIRPWKLRRLNYNPLLERVKNKLTAWTTKYLSYGARLLLISTVVYGMVNSWSRIPLVLHGHRKKGFWGVTPSPRQSSHLRKLLGFRSEAKKFIKCTLGNGLDADFWHDNWTGLGPLIEVTGVNGPRLLKIPLYAKVKVGLRTEIGTSRGPDQRCDFSMQLWDFFSSLCYPSPPTSLEGCARWLEGQSEGGARRELAELVIQVTTYIIWRERNSRVFKQEANSIAKLRVVLDTLVRDTVLSRGHSTISTTSTLEDLWLAITSSIRIHLRV